MTRAGAAIVATSLVALLWPGFAEAATQRTFVASYGVTAHTAFNCSLAKPCRAFSEAIGVTSAGGEIVVLDTAGYGSVTITKSVAIVAPPGVHAGISVFAGTNGVDIPTGGVTVALRGLSISGQGGTHGIYVTGDNGLTIERCDIGGMGGNGIFLDSVAGTVQIRDTVVHDSALNGLIFVGALSATLNRVASERNLLAGVAVYEGGMISLKDSTLVRNNHGIEVGNFSAGLTTSVHGDGLQLTRNNQHGMSAAVSNGDVRIRLTRSTIDLNPAGGAEILVTGAGGKVRGSFIENTFAGNGPSSIYLDRGPGLPNAAQVTIARNAFADGFVNAKGPNGGQFLTDQHNTEEPDSLVAPTDGNRLF